MAEKPILVKAIHSYTPVNNDELKLDKGDILTVARKEDGGWWEGTLPNGKTGWFPSNYVEDLPVLPSSPAVSAPTVASPSPLPSVKKSPQQEGQPLPSNSFVDSSAFAAQQAEYRQVAFNELMESESTHLSELQVFWETYMIPLQKADLLSPGEFKVLTGNLPELMHVHLNSLLNLLKAEQNKPLKEQCIGSIFLENAPKIETVLKTYCSNHPKAVQVVEKHKEELGSFIESKGGRKPGILHIITYLSQAFRRLEKYPTLLQEIERHVEEFHKDRGDLQRSIEYYKEIQKTCSALRKQKEMELEVLSGSIKGWEGADVCQLGDIIFMNLVHLGYERQPRYFVLFPNTLLILSYNTESNSLVYEGKVPVSGITMKPLIDKDTLTNAFEIAGPMIDQIIVGCTSKAIRETWLGHLNSILKSNRFPSFSSSPQQVHFSKSVDPDGDDDHATTSTTKAKGKLSHENYDSIFPKCSTAAAKTSIIKTSQQADSNSNYKYIPSKTPPYVELVAYFQTLFKKGIIQSKSFEYMEALELDFDNIDIECKRRIKPVFTTTAAINPSVNHVSSLDVANFFDKSKKRQQLLFGAAHPTFEISFCSSSSTETEDNFYESDDNSTVRGSKCSSTCSSSPSEYRLTKEPGYPFHKWRWGMSNLCVEKLKSPSFLSPSSCSGGRMGAFKGMNSGGGSLMRERSPGDLNLDKSRSITFGDNKLYWKVKGTFSSFMSRSQSLPVIKSIFSDYGEQGKDGGVSSNVKSRLSISERKGNVLLLESSRSTNNSDSSADVPHSDVGKIDRNSFKSCSEISLQSYTTDNATIMPQEGDIGIIEGTTTLDTGNGSSDFVRGRLVRQNAFDYDDGEVENLPDLNDNLQLVNNAGQSSFDSGLGDLTPSNRTTQTNFYEEISFEISAVISPPSVVRAATGGDREVSSGGGEGSRSQEGAQVGGESYRSNLYAHWLLKFESSSNL